MKKPIETWRDERNTPAWLWAAVRTEEPAGKELTGEQYDALCARLAGLPIGQPVEAQNG